MGVSTRTMLQLKHDISHLGFTEQRERLQIKDNDENAIADICTSKIGGNSSCATLSDTHVLCIKKVVRDADVIKLGDIDPTPQLALPNAYSAPQNQGGLIPLCAGGTCEGGQAMGYNKKGRYSGLAIKPLKLLLPVIYATLKILNDGDNTVWKLVTRPALKITSLSAALEEESKQSQFQEAYRTIAIPIVLNPCPDRMVLVFRGIGEIFCPSIREPGRPIQGSDEHIARESPTQEVVRRHEEELRVQGEMANVAEAERITLYTRVRSLEIIETRLHNIVRDERKARARGSFSSVVHPGNGQNKVPKWDDPSFCSSFRRPVRDGIEKEQWLEMLSMLDTVMLSSSIDRWVCDLNGEGDFRVKDVRSSLDELFLPSMDVATRWVKFVPKKINVFAWRARLDRLPTRLNLIKRAFSGRSVFGGIFLGEIVLLLQIGTRGSTL
ncbi:hypothetical protein Tco_1054718 [Tanacetum coccineum]|uniref:Reverse transcriptase zinc-binding domain-containing protein n=1 Tax=Tanacetum coccineum TaxID=301880 RepID=A0ABQ5GXL2_9ASTR